jgi:putative ABC transport system ATP-binding protein
LLVSGVRAGESRRRAKEGLAWVGLIDWASHRPAELSGGQRQRVAIARALVNQPSIIWADEPTGNLDSESAAEIMALMKQLNQENGQTFVVVTHAQDVASWTHRTVHMRDGIITDSGASTIDHAQSTAENVNKNHQETR